MVPQVRWRGTSISPLAIFVPPKMPGNLVRACGARPLALLLSKLDATQYMSFTRETISFRVSGQNAMRRREFLKNRDFAGMVLDRVSGLDSHEDVPYLEQTSPHVGAAVHVDGLAGDV